MFVASRGFIRFFSTLFAMVSSLAALAMPAMAALTLNSASPTTFSGPGETITFSYTFDGENTQVNSVSVSGPLFPLTGFSCSGLPLAINGSTTCTGTYTTTGADVSDIIQGGGLWNATTNGAPRNGSVTGQVTVTYVPPGVATQMSIAGGNNQNATITSSFTNPVSVLVRDAGNNPVSGVNVTFTAPGSGASALFSNSTNTITVGTNASGFASAFISANSIGGSYSVSAAAAGLTTVNFSMTNNAATTTTSVVSSLNPSLFGQSVTFTASVNASAGGTITGSVTFKDGASIIGSGTLDGAGQATFSTSALSGGSHTITAVYDGTASFATSTSPSITQVVNQATQMSINSGNNQSTVISSSFTNPISVLVRDASNNPVAGVDVTFTAPASGAGAFFFNSTNTITVATNASGLAVALIVANGTGGSYSVSAAAAGLTTVNFSMTNNAATTTTTVVSSLNPSTFGQSVTFTASVSASAGGTITGSVTFKDGASTIGSGTMNGAGQATFSTSALSGGSHTITAVYDGAASFATSTSPSITQVVNGASQVINFTQPLDQTFAPAGTLGLSATGGASGNPVAFGGNSNAVCTVAGSTVTFVSVGVCSVTATQAGNTNYVAATPVTRTFNIGQASQVINFTQPLDQTYSPGGTLGLSATGGASGNPVAFDGNSNSVCTVAGSTVTFVAVGVCSVTATQAGSTNYAAATPVTRTFNINQAATTTTVASSTSSSLLGEPVTLSATVSPSVATGTVTFKDGATDVCTNVALVGGSASCVTSFSSAGGHSITASYGGSSLYATSTSGPLVITVTDQRFKTAEVIGKFLQLRNDMLLTNGPADGRQIDRLMDYQEGGGSSDFVGTSRGYSSGAVSAFDGTVFASSGTGAARSGLADRLSGLRASTDIVRDSAASFFPDMEPFSGSRDISGARDFSFATSMNQLMRASAGRDAQTLNANGGSGAKYPGGSTSRFDVWVEGRYVSFDDEQSPSADHGHFGAIYAGADYVVRPWLLLGGMVQYDSLMQSSPLGHSKAEGTGWMAGPYATVRLSPNLFLQGRAMWGTSDNKVSPFLTYTDSFESERWLVSSTLAGSWSDKNWRFQPSATFAYVEDTTDSYVDHFGITIPSFSSSLGQLKVEPEVSYVHENVDGTVLEPRLKGSLIWNFESSDSLAGFGNGLTGPEDLRGRIEAGATLRFKGGASIDLSGSYDGIGSDSYSATGINLSVRVPLN